MERIWRGKDKKTNKWIVSKMAAITPKESALWSPDESGKHVQHVIHPETLCDFSGYYDNDRNMIFDQDVLVVQHAVSRIWYVVQRPGMFVVCFGDLAYPIDEFLCLYPSKVLTNTFDSNINKLRRAE